MNFMPRWPWLRTVGMPTVAARREAADQADMGTAFGLDASFENTPEPPVTARRSAATATRPVSPLTGLPRT